MKEIAMEDFVGAYEVESGKGGRAIWWFFSE
jgi:hypothetical protein